MEIPHHHHHLSDAETAQQTTEHWLIAPITNFYTIRNCATDLYMSTEPYGLHAGSPDKHEHWYINSKEPSAATSSWMGKNWKWLEKQRLDQICLPGSHDSGTFEQTMATKYASRDNTRTQMFDIRMQLMQGVRVFDLRPVLYDGTFYTAHQSKNDLSGHQGAIGTRLDKAFDQIADFVKRSESSKELIILHFSHFINWNRRDRQPDFNLDEKQALSSLLQSRLGLHLISGSTSALKDSTLNALMFGNGTRRNVLAVFHSFHYGSSDSGLWNAPDYPMFGSWADTESMDRLRADQLGKMRTYSHAATRQSFELCWQLSLSTADNVTQLTSLVDLAKKANPNLSPTIREWHRTGLLTREFFPNVINTDFCEESTTHAVNLSVQITRELGYQCPPEPVATTTLVFVYQRELYRCNDDGSDRQRLSADWEEVALTVTDPRVLPRQNIAVHNDICCYHRSRGRDVLVVRHLTRQAALELEDVVTDQKPVFHGANLYFAKSDGIYVLDTTDFVGAERIVRYGESSSSLTPRRLIVHQAIDEEPHLYYLLPTRNNPSNPFSDIYLELHRCDINGENDTWIHFEKDPDTTDRNNRDWNGFSDQRFIISGGRVYFFRDSRGNSSPAFYLYQADLGGGPARAIGGADGLSVYGSVTDRMFLSPDGRYLFITGENFPLYRVSTGPDNEVRMIAEGDDNGALGISGTHIVHGRNNHFWLSDFDGVKGKATEHYARGGVVFGDLLYASRNVDSTGYLLRAEIPTDLQKAFTFKRLREDGSLDGEVAAVTTIRR